MAATNVRPPCRAASPRTPSSPGSGGQPYFKFTDPAVHASALTIKERLLQWCRDKTRDYEVPTRLRTPLTPTASVTNTRHYVLHVVAVLYIPSRYIFILFLLI